ncbi:efflux RND transporter periplasmic adaptor subunit [Xylophilus sp. GW821-FHT01B05]
MARKSSSVSRLQWGAAVLVVLVLAGAGAWLLRSPSEPEPQAQAPLASKAGKVGPETVRIAADQAAALDVGAVGERQFDHRRQTIGNIDFNQDRTTPVYTPYQGRIAQVLVKAGDDVKAGQTLYTVAVPDIAQAASTLISTAGALHAANETLRRAQVLAKDDSIPQKELQQNQSDQQTAEAAYNAARKSLRLFDLSDADIARLERDRNVGIEMPVKSPIAGRVTARTAQVGLLVQPGTAPAPVTVADMRTLWMVASVPESEFALYHIGQPVDVRVQAWPGKVFSGRVSYVGDSVDANSRRLVVRADVNDPARALRPQMLADFSIAIAAPETSVAVPATAVVRETNGSNAVWVATSDDAEGPRFVRRTVVTGLTTDGQVQIASGLKAGERIARRNALFLSNLYETNAD